MADSGSDTADRVLSAAFKEAFHLHNNVVNSCVSNTEPSLQEEITKAIDILEDLTYKVSQLGVFSSNETLEEVATSNLNYFLLPVLLGNLTIRKHVEDRMQVLQVAEVYYKDFLRRCQEYGITKNHKQEEEEGAARAENLLAKREAKIKRYKDQKTLEQKVKVIETLMSTCNIDEEKQRDYYISSINLFIYTAQDELDSIKSEIPLVLKMAEMKSQPKKQEPPAAPHKKLKPVIITRSKLEKEVFGAGYPSIPTMTVEEWAEQQIAQGMLPSRGIVNSDTTESSEREVDEDVARAKAQAWDEYRDEHRRGEGNRYNRS